MLDERSQVGYAVHLAESLSGAHITGTPSYDSAAYYSCVPTFSSSEVVLELQRVPPMPRERETNPPRGE